MNQNRGFSAHAFLRRSIASSTSFWNCNSLTREDPCAPIERAEGLLLQPRTVAVDVVRGTGQTWAIAADDGFKGLVEASVVGIGGGETLARCRDAVAQPGEIDRL